MKLNDLGRHPLVVLCALVAALWIAAGTTFEAKKITIKTQVDDRFSFEGLHAWTWSPDGTGQVKMATTANADPEALRQRVDPVIVPVVEQELAKLGFTKTTDKPDLIVNYYVLVTVGQSSQYMGQFVGSIPQWGLPPFEGLTTALRAFPVGTLLIDMVSPSEKVRRLARRGTSGDRPGAAARGAATAARAGRARGAREVSAQAQEEVSRSGASLSKLTTS